MLSRKFSIAVLALLISSAFTVAFAAQSASAQSYSVTMSSPASGVVFNRGETVTVTASVTSSGAPVSGATVTATNPTGGAITLSQTATPGTYSGQYLVQASDPVGAWVMIVQAVSGGESANTQTTVSVSLMVSILSPGVSATLNVGESATVKATVTYQDGSPLPPSASVSFAKPSGGAVSMSVDPSDTSGKTWTGTYAVVASDVPADGVTWPVTVSASLGGNSGSSVRDASLFKSLVVAASTFGSSAYGTPQTSFQIGQIVYVRAIVGLHDGTITSSGTVSFTITGTSASATPLLMTFSPSANYWTGSYSIESTDQKGTQTVTVSASDSQGNAGSGSQQITIGTGTQGVAVSLTSPSSGSVFNRGQTVTIAASVTVAGSPATAATVTANSPTGGTITLANVGSGTYTAQYTLSSTDPSGAWTIEVQASQPGLSGSSHVAVTVSSSLKVAVSTWSSSSFTVPQSTFSTGQTVFVKAQASLQSGAAVSSGTTTFAITGTSTAGSPVTMTFSNSLDAWVGSYTVAQGDHTGSQTVTVDAKDGNGNTGSGARSVGINAPASTISQQPLEAAITFNPSSHGILVNAVCNAGCVGPTSVTTTVTGQVTSSGHGDDQGNGHGHGNGDRDGNHGKGSGSVITCVVTDSAGHSVTLKVRVKDDGHEVKATVFSIQYGSSPPVAAPRNQLSFQYSLAKDGNLKTLQESASAEGAASARAHYNAGKDTTTIAIGTASHGEGKRSSTTDTGLWLLELGTSNGALSVSNFQSQ